VDIDKERFTHPQELLDIQRTMENILSEFENYVRSLTSGLDFELKVDVSSMSVTTTPKRVARLGKVIRVKKKRTTTVDVTNDTIDQYLYDYQYTKEKFEELYGNTLRAFQREWFRTCHAEMSHLTDVVADVDVVKASAVEYEYTRPVIETKDVSFVRGEKIRHPIIERQDTVRYVANDVVLNKGMLLYGINGAGKSSYGRAVALNVILAQAGFFVPAQTFTYSPYERLYTRIGCDDNMYEGLSSFWLEIIEMNGIIRSGNNKSLVIGDELFKGTEDVSAMALVSACLHWMCERHVSFIFATHLHKLPQIQLVKDLNLRVMHMKSEYCKHSKSIVFNRTWCEGQGESNYGIEVAEYILDDPTIIHNAKMVRHELCETLPTIRKPSRYNRDLWVDECKHCKSKKNLHTHHIQPQKDGINNKFSNLIPLCEDCHHDIHANLLEHNVLDGINGSIHLFTRRI
jgi:DNA mismatch repair protein MutS